MLSQEQLLEVIRRFREHDPDPKIELHYNNLFTLLIAVVLSARAKDATVNRATQSLFLTHRTPQAFLAMDAKEMEEAFKTIGLYRTKVANIRKLCAILVDRYDGQVPTTYHELIQLPGVGDKSANCILNVWCNQPTMPVDTHVFRVSIRLGLVPPCKTRQEVQRHLLIRIPPQDLNKMHHYLVLHGRYVCKACKPQCAQCFLNDVCVYNALS